VNEVINIFIYSALPLRLIFIALSFKKKSSKETDTSIENLLNQISTNIDDYFPGLRSKYHAK